MPGMTGIELVKAIREIHPAMPVIMNSGFSNKIDAGAAAEMDIRFLEKPVSANCLIQVVAELLGPAE